MESTMFTGAYRIMLIDDDIDFLMLLERRLAKEGFILESAASLQEAEELLPLFQPDLVLLDINVNGEDGRGFCFKMKQQAAYASSRVILLSGYDPDKGRASLFGADDVLSKPVNYEYLLQVIEQTRLGQLNLRLVPLTARASSPTLVHH